jgi:RNA 3'-phosphate cyclase
METLEVDGSYGEGGGQILRTAAALSIITHRPIHVTKIRAGRDRPGLRSQHAACLKILRDLSGGRLDGAEVGSEEITFAPGAVEKTSMAVDLRTAASATLVLQAVVPAVSLSGASVRLDLVGGTDVPWSPPFDYFASVVREGFRLIGINFSASAPKRGYYPRGGGRVESQIEPCRALKGLELAGPLEHQPTRVVSRCGGLPRRVAERQLDSAVSVLRRNGWNVGEQTVSEEESDSPGTSIVLTEIGNGFVLGADALGARGKRAEDVGKEAGDSFAALRWSGACLDSCLADMLAPILPLAEGESRLLVPRVTRHLTTSLYVAGLFTNFSHSFEKKGDSTCLSIRPSRTT